MFPFFLIFSSWGGEEEGERARKRTLNLFPVRGVERESTNVKKDTHDHAHRAANVHPAGAPVAELLEAQPPSSAQARADTFIGVVPKHQPLLDAFNPGQHSRVPFVVAPIAMLEVTHLPDLGHTASAARDLIPCMVESAIPTPAGARPAIGAVETGSFFGVMANDSESLATFCSLVTPTARLAPPPRVDSQVAGPFRVTEMTPSCSSPLPS